MHIFVLAVLNLNLKYSKFDEINLEVSGIEYAKTLQKLGTLSSRNY